MKVKTYVMTKTERRGQVCHECVSDGAAVANAALQDLQKTRSNTGIELALCRQKQAEMRKKKCQTNSSFKR